MQVGYDSFCKSDPNLTKKLLQNWNKFRIKIMRNIIWQGRRVNLSKNVTCPDHPDFKMQLNSKNGNYNWSFLPQLSSARPLISAIWQPILYTPYKG